MSSITDADAREYLDTLPADEMDDLIIRFDPDGEADPWDLDEALVRYARVRLEEAERLGQPWN